MKPFLVLLLLAGMGSAQQTQSTDSAKPSDDAGKQTAQEILALCSAAMGSDRAERDYYAEGVVTSLSHPGVQGILLIKSKEGNRQRQEESYGGKAQLTVSSGGAGSSFRDGKKQALPGHVAAGIQPDHSPALFCRADRGNRGLNVEYLGQEMRDERPAHHLRWSALPLGKNKRADAAAALISENHVFVDAESKLVISAWHWIFSLEGLENRSRLETVYSDYRLVDGVMMPFHIENRVDGQKFREATLQTVRSDVAVQDSDFQ